jgi:hypothetical protein
MPRDSVLRELEGKVDTLELERVLMNEGTTKFAEAQKSLLRRIAEKRASALTIPAGSSPTTKNPPDGGPR